MCIYCTYRLYNQALYRCRRRHRRHDGRKSMVPFMPLAVYTCRCVCVSVRACLCAWTEGIRGQVELPKFTAHNTHPDVSYIRTRRQSDTGKRAFRSSPMWGRRRRCRLRHSASLCSAFAYIAQKWERARGV